MPGSSTVARADRRAIIIGGSMSGLFSAAFLRQIGWDVDVYERSPVELEGRGAGITTHPELMEALEASGAGTRDLGVEVPKRFAIDRQGRITGERPLRQILTSWDRLQRLLRETIDPARYHLGRGFERVEQDGSGVRVHFSDGGVENADLLIGGDGIRSSVRGDVAPEIQPNYAGYYIWRGAPNEANLSPKVLKEIFPYFVFYLPPRQEVITYPIAGFNNDLRPGHRRYNVVWYRPADERTKLPWLLTDESGTTHTISIPPPLIRREVIAEMRADAERLLGPQFRQVARMIDEPILQPIYDLESSQMAFGRVAMVGDASFVARPHVAAGVSKAADDAAALTEAVSTESDVAAALKRFEAARLPDNHRIIERARHLGAFLQATKTQEEQARAGRHSTDDAVIKETAVLDFLYA
jgi:2-polyprenyl-6-methoxyphenol hydroxylase-like FAD-dependent oxidoreductase